MTESSVLAFFRESLMRWHFENPRPLPWKDTNNPYKIWLSEIILQQTQVVQGIPYYERFIKKYPSVFDLAAASEAEVLKDWQGLGYNSRARNLRKTAITVAEEYNGYFPNTYDGLLELSGVGPYTAAAIASFAFGVQIPVIDTNVKRILCRFEGIEEFPEGRIVHSKMNDFLHGTMAETDPAEFNQAIMNFGALQCVPKKPVCSSCVLNTRCFAYNAGRVHDFPKPKKLISRKVRFFHYLVLASEEGTMMKRRAEKDIWEGMYDFPLKELASGNILNRKQIREWVVSICDTDQFQMASPVSEIQVLTHQKICCTFYPCTLKFLPEKSGSAEISFVSFGNLHKFALPKIIDCYFRLKSILL